jgi:Flp pilus assembly protein TadG
VSWRTRFGRCVTQLRAESGDERGEEGRAQRGDERGLASAFVVMMLVTLMMCAGLALDGARMMGARRNLQLVAAGAARTGSQWLDETALNQGVLALDETAATAAVVEVLDQQGIDSAHRSVEYLGNGALRVKVSREVPMILLWMMGVPTKTVSASAQSQSVKG